LVHTPRYLRQMPMRLKWQFLFCQLLYPIFGVTFLLMYLLPILAVVFDFRYAEITFPQYLSHAMPQIAALLLLASALRRQKVFRPVDAPLISWERTLFLMLQWPWVLWGCISAVRDSLTGRFVDFRITPKGDTGPTRLPMKVWAVYAILALGCILPVLLAGNLEQAQGFYLLTLFSGSLYTATLSVTVLRHFHENGWPVKLQWRDVVVQTGVVATIATLLFSAFAIRAAESVYALSIGLEPVKIVEVQVNVAGAGSANREPFGYRFNFEWGDETAPVW
jgi:cellulose synthase (UDP-forming)